jgi:hypothetical protein
VRHGKDEGNHDDNNNEKQNDSGKIDDRKERSSHRGLFRNSSGRVAGSFRRICLPALSPARQSCFIRSQLRGVLGRAGKEQGATAPLLLIFFCNITDCLVGHRNRALTWVFRCAMNGKHNEGGLV